MSAEWIKKQTDGDFRGSLVLSDRDWSITAKSAVDLLDSHLQFAESEIKQVEASRQEIVSELERVSIRLSAVQQTKKNIIDAIVKLRNG